MPITPAILNKYGQQQFVVVEQTQTIQHAIETLHTKKYDEYQAYLLVQSGERQYKVTSFSQLMKTVIAPLGYDSLIAPLNTLPIPPADLVLSTDIPQSGLEVVDWVAARPQACVVVVNNEGVAGLFTNPNRSGGFFDGISLYRLHGELAQADQPHKTFSQIVSPPACPECGKKDFAKFRNGMYCCPHCNYKQEHPW